MTWHSEHAPGVSHIIAARGDPAGDSEIVFCGSDEPTLRLKLLLDASDHIHSRHGGVRVNATGLASLVA